MAAILRDALENQEDSSDVKAEIDKISAENDLAKELNDEEEPETEEKKKGIFTLHLLEKNFFTMNSNKIGCLSAEKNPLL